MTDYLRLAQQQAEQQAALDEPLPLQPKDDANPYLDLAQGLASREQERARFLIDTALKADPVRAAEIQRLKNTTGIPPDMIERNFEEVRRREALSAINLVQIAKDSPVLARQLQDPNFTTVAVDDIGLLHDLGRIVQDTGVAALSGAVRLPQAVVGIADIATLGQAGKALESVGYRPNEALDILNEFYSEQTQRALSRVQNADGFFNTLATALRNPSTVATTVIESLPSVIGGAAFARLITGVYGSVSPLLGAATGEGLMAAGAMAEDLRGDTPDGELNLRQALGSAAAGFGTAILGAAGGRIAGRLGLNDIDTALASGDLTGTATPGFAKQVLGQGLSEGVFEELPQSVQEQMWQNFANERPLFEGVGNAAAMGTLAGSATGAGFGAYSTAVAKIVGAAAQQADQIERADQDAKRLADALRIAQDSKLRERSPDQFRQLISQMTSDANLYVDGEVLAQLPPEVQAQLPATVQEQIQQAAAIGDVVTISQADALTVAPGTELEQVLVDNARTSPDAMSAAEARQASEQAQVFLQQEAERVIAQAEDQEAMRASSEAVRQSILGELNAAGRYRGSVNEAMSQWASAFYTTMASRVGMTPEEFYQRYRLRVLGETQGQGEVLNAPGEMALRTVNTGDTVDGRVVREGVPNMESISASLENYEVLPGVREVPVSAFDPEYVNSITLDRLDERTRRLADEIQQSGEINPLIVVQDSEGMYVLEGGHRFDALIASGAKSLPAVVVTDLDNPPAQAFEQRAAQPTRRARPIPPQIAAAADVGNARTIAASRQWPTNRDFKLAIQNAVRAVMGQRDLRADTPENRAYITQQLLKEAREALVTNSNAIGWYDEKVTTALEVVSTIHPELKTDEQAKFAFIWALAVTSNGVKVDKNFELAERSYRYWKDNNGRLPTSGIGVGPTASKIHEGLRAYNDLIQRWGFARLQSFATTLQPNRDVRAAYGRKVSGEGMDTQVYGAGILGPKIGNGFFMNLYGEFGQLTMDRWWVRMWGRITGDLVEIDPQGTRAARDAFVSLIDIVKADRQALRAVEQAIGAKLNKGSPVETAKAIIKATSKEEVRDALDLILPATPEREAAAKAARGKLKDFVSIGDELRKAAKSYYKYLDGQIEVPGGSKRRDMMREVSQAVLAELQKDNPSLTMADFQALMWYPEKTLYDSAGAQEQDSEGYDDDEAPDYANAAIKLARDQGISDADINAAVEQARSDIASRQRAGRSGRGSAGVSPAQGDGAGADTGGTFAQGGVDGGSQQARDGAGREAGTGPTPLPGAPVVEGATGPDPRLVAVAEQYARDNGIDLRRQGRYAKVDRERAARIAAAYEAMAHDPQNPQVKEAYENLIRQTVAQYRALEAAGYKFWFIDPTNDPYTSPWDAMRDMRSTQTMGVFPTIAGFGSGATDVDVTDNPLMVDTGILWPNGSPDGELKPVLANDLFRAVHDAFGHGLEGAGFRAQGEENAWQAHIRLFTGSAVGAVTSETRGQNSWLNFGPYGETNRTAKVEDTVFADQKTGLLPEWTWAEGRVEDMPEQPLQQGPRGTFNPRTLELVLNPNADLSTWFHETGHFFLEVMADVASQPGAPAQIADDMNAFLQWAGVPDLATWNGYSLEQKRPYHERWAESIEQYVMEGRAPSVELQPLMRRFSAWLKNVYGSIKQFLTGRPDAERIQLNDDIRRVMDSMLATDEQIQQANAVAGLAPDEQADGEAMERLQRRSMADLKWAVNARDKAIRKLQRETREIEKQVRAEVTAEVDATPEMRARAAQLQLRKSTPEYKAALKAWQDQRQVAKDAAAQTIRDSLLATEGQGLTGLKKGQFLSGKKREIENQAEAAALQWEQANPKPERTLVGSDSDMAAIADAFGYESVAAMNAAIEAFGKRADVINERTEQRMLNEYGDLVDERAIQEAANEAVHNEARARSLASELRSQQEMINQRRDTGRTNARGARITVSALLEAGRQFGANVVARTPIGKLRGVAWRHTSAERRAGTRWRDATMKGETAEAVQAQRDRFLNNAAAKAAVEAQAEVRKFLEFFKRVNRGNNEKVVERGRNPDIVNAARAILSAYGMQSAASKNAAAYLELVKKNDPEVYATIEPIVQQALVNSKPMDELTFDEIVGLHESIQSLWFLSKRSRQMEVDGKLVDIDDSAQELFARMQAIGIPDRIAGEGMAVTKEEERGLFLKQGIAFLRRVEQWAEGMDGRYGGPFLRLVFQPIKDAADRYRKDRLEYRKKFQALVDNLAPIVGDSVIQAPELLYTFGTPGSTAGTAMNEILHAIAHTGNESNKRKLLLGRGWAIEREDGTLDTSRWDSFIQRLVNEGKLVEAHFDFVQGVWDLLEETKTLAQKAHRDAFGRYFNEITANEFVDPFGVTRRGGYIPAQVDARLVKDNALRRLAEEENQSMAFAFPQPAKGFTMSRVEYNRELMLDLRSLSQHIDKVLLFSHMTVPARDVRKLLMRSTVSQPLSRIQPAALESMLQPWLQRSAQQIVETPIVGTGRWARIPGIVRSRAGMALMFGNISNAIQQITGLSTAAVRVKPSFLMRSLSQYVSNPWKFSRAVWDTSPYMNDRALNEVAVLNEQMKAILIQPSTYERMQDWSMRHAYFLQTALDNVLSPIIWTGAYNQALADGMSDKDAVRFADGTVRQTQGSTLPEDVSRIETGPAYARAFTQFVGYFNMMANTNATAFKQLMGEVGLKKGAGKALYIVMMGLMVPIWVAEAIALAMRGGPEDDDDDGYLDDWLAQVFGMGTVKGLLAQIPIAGQFGVAATNRFNNNPLDDRVSLSPAISLLESAVGAPQSVYEAIVEDGSSQKAIRDVATLVSVATGVPLYGVSRPIGYMAGVIEGRIEPQGLIDVMRGLVTGTASPESKAQ